MPDRVQSGFSFTSQPTTNSVSTIPFQFDNYVTSGNVVIVVTSVIVSGCHFTAVYDNEGRDFVRVQKASDLPHSIPANFWSSEVAVWLSPIINTSTTIAISGDIAIPTYISSGGVTYFSRQLHVEEWSGIKTTTVTNPLPNSFASSLYSLGEHKVLHIPAINTVPASSFVYSWAWSGELWNVGGIVIDQNNQMPWDEIYYWTTIVSEFQIIKTGYKLATTNSSSGSWDIHNTVLNFNDSSAAAGMVSIPLN